MLTNYNRRIKYLIIFLTAIPISILLLRPLVASSDKYFFLTIILTVSLLVLWKPKNLFLLSVGGAILFYHPFLLEVLFQVGNAKVYTQDLLFAAMTIYLVVQAICKYRSDVFKLKSNRFFILFFLWGLLSIVRGYPHYGFSAIGESRWYVLVILYYFFILFSFHYKKDVPWFLNWMAFFISVMIIEHFVLFFFFGGDVGKIGRSAFRFINATETLLIAFLMIFLFLFYLTRRRKISILWLNVILFFILSSIIIVVQTRSVWLATAGGLFAVYIFIKEKSVRGLVSIGLAIFLLFSIIPFMDQFVGADISATLKQRAMFLQSPEDDATASWRLNAWQQELQRSKDNFIIGEGLGGYSEWFDGQRWQRVAVHNGYIMTFSKFGIAGLFLLFVGLFFWYKEMNQYVKNEKEPYYKLIGMALQVAVFMHLIYTTFYDFSVFFWILLGLGSSIIMNQKKGFSVENKILT